MEEFYKRHVQQLQAALDVSFNQLRALEAARARDQQNHFNLKAQYDELLLKHQNLQQMHDIQKNLLLTVQRQNELILRNNCNIGQQQNGANPRGSPGSPLGAAGPIAGSPQGAAGLPFGGWVTPPGSPISGFGVPGSPANSPIASRLRFRSHRQ